MNKQNLENPACLSSLPIMTPAPGFYDDQIDANLSSDSDEVYKSQLDSSVTAFVANQISDNIKNI